MSNVKTILKNIGAARLIIILFLFSLIIAAAGVGQSMSVLASDSLVRFGMNLVLTLAMVPAVMSGTGMNFGLPVGILCGILGGLTSIELGGTGMGGLVLAIAVALPISAVAGYLYGRLLNMVKGSEMMIGTYVGYSMVSIMCIGWLLMPFKNPSMVWPIAGRGLRATISMDSSFGSVLDKLWAFQIGGLTVPTGLILFSLFMCLLVYLFTKSKTGIAMAASGDNPRFAEASGISVNRSRIIGTMLSTMLAAVGIVVYAQSFGFMQLYQAPLNMAFAPVAAALLGGASTSKIKISHVIIGTILFQSLLTIALPVANVLMPEGNLSEVIRLIVSNGIILFALTQAGGGRE